MNKPVYLQGIILVFLLSFTLSSCKVNYSFSGASVSPDIKTVSIQYFKITTSAPLAKSTLSLSLSDALKNMFISQTNLTVVPNNADLNFEGEITGYQTAPSAIQSNDVSALNRLTIAVNVKFTNEKDPKQNFESSFSRYADYKSSQNLSAVEGDLIEQINKQLVQDIFNKAMINW